MFWFPERHMQSAHPEVLHFLWCVFKNRKKAKSLMNSGINSNQLKQLNSSQSLHFSLPSLFEPPPCLRFIRMHCKYKVHHRAQAPLRYAWGHTEQSRAGLISPQAVAGRLVVGGWWISVPGTIMVGQKSIRVKDNSLASLLNKMQIKLKAAEQQIPP